MVNINNITGKLTKNVDKIGILVGAASYGIDALIENIMLLPTQGHIPDIKATIDEFLHLKELNPAIMILITGWAAKEFGYAKYGNPLMKFGEGYLKGLGIQHILFHSTHAGEGSAGTPVERMFNRSVVAPNQTGYGY